MSEPIWYRLEGKVAIPTKNFAESAMASNQDRRVARDEINGSVISTVFLGVDHSFGEGRPLLFETLFYIDDVDHIIRYTTWEEAEEGHKECVERVRSESGDYTPSRGVVFAPNNTRRLDDK